ncbi:hypothetical protein [Vibrio gangliei]|uniref:hypothetical protein n=1 Tax=Vibrio gangliei TaxID=2077090 RepID=UPI000D016F94|nr:hypothetical protein [Vibrio gangliei]
MKFIFIGKYFRDLLRDAIKFNDNAFLSFNGKDLVLETENGFSVRSELVESVDGDAVKTTFKKELNKAELLTELKEAKSVLIELTNQSIAIKSLTY